MPVGKTVLAVVQQECTPFHNIGDTRQGSKIIANSLDDLKVKARPQFASLKATFMLLEPGRLG